MSGKSSRRFICDRTRVRADLQERFPAEAGADQVTHSSFLDVTAHGMETLRALFAHTTSHATLTYNPNDFCIIAISNDRVGNGSVTGDLEARHRLVVLNTGNNTHFDPLLQ